MVFNKKTGDNNRDKQMDFVSRLTFIRGLKDAPERITITQKERTKRKFKHWSMPTQPDGYIKCRKHDFL